MARCVRQEYYPNCRQVSGKDEAAILDGHEVVCMAIATPRGRWQSGKLDFVFSVSQISAILYNVEHVCHEWHL